MIDDIAQPPLPPPHHKSHKYSFLSVFTKSFTQISLRPRQGERVLEMCPLRIILIFLSATLAGFFLLKNLNSPPDLQNDDVSEDLTETTNSVPLSSKVCTAAGKGFWTFVDMASGRYLWRNMISSTSASTAKLSAD